MALKIDKIDNRDLEEAKRFCLGIFEEMGWSKKFAYGLENLKDFFSGSREVFFLVKDGKKIVGCAGLRKISKTEGLIKRFYVAKEYRGKGLAEKILEKIKQFARDKNYKTIMVDIFQDNERAKRFFQKQDFLIFNPDSNDPWPETKYSKIFEFRRLEL